MTRYENSTGVVTGCTWFAQNSRCSLDVHHVHQSFKHETQSFPDATILQTYIRSLRLFHGSQQRLTISRHEISRPLHATWIMQGLPESKMNWRSCFAWRRLLPACARALANCASRAKQVCHVNIEQIVPLLNDDAKLFITSSRAEVKCHNATIMLFMRFQKHSRA